MSWPPPDGEPYRPSNGTEGDIFESNLCERCHKWRGGNCGINMRAYLHDTDEKGYPKQWVWQDRQPACTAFVARGTVARSPRRQKPPAGQLELLEQ